jgi:hypothetical protein
MTLTKNIIKLNSVATVNCKAEGKEEDACNFRQKIKEKKQAVQEKYSFTRPSSLRSM